ncbi:MAG: Fur family transcriptional regulator [Candidatus Izemoplasmatales bacterium]|nr:Fur family transcriptional regulator [Candidatus Izemoplasmatales bacterium]MDD4070292.1 Fur family transcriptional regulator [Candidatus Izemoplasmatales bacterium]
MDKLNIISKMIDSGLKNTKPRVNIIDLLEKSDSLLTAQDIYDSLKESGVKVNLSTVYRSLDKLTENNILNKVSLESEKQTLYEYNREIHHHFLVCKSCNKVKSIYSCPLDNYELELEKKTNFVITGHKIEFYGYCKECQKKLKNSGHLV